MKPYFSGERILRARSGRVTGWFKPNGKLRGLGRGSGTFVANRARWSSDQPIQAARLFVGFSVHDKPTYTLRDLIDLVRAIRTEQTGDPSASFIAQKGIYAHQQEDLVVEEDGAQVILLNVQGIPAKAFEAQMVDLATQIAEAMQQEEVIVEMQRGGVAQRTIGVGP